jgi:vacuolar-type H+-ATPase subunit H
MHQQSEQSEFVKTVKEIRDAEEEYDRLIKSAKEKADNIMREAKEKTISERMKNEEDIITYKNEYLKEGSEAINAEVQKLISKAKDDGAKLTKKKPDKAAVSKLVNDFISNL